MIFTFPAIISSNTDKNILPAVLKTLEQYYLIHLVTALSSGYIRIRIEVDKNGRQKEVIVEDGCNIPTDLKYLIEQSIPPPSPDAHIVPYTGTTGQRKPQSPAIKSDPVYTPTFSPEQKPTSTSKPTTNPNQWGSQSRTGDAPSRNPSTSPGIDKSNPKIETFEHIGILPTMVAIDVEVERPPRKSETVRPFAAPHERGPDYDFEKDRNKKPDDRNVYERKTMLMGVKVTPMMVTHFDNLYDVLRKDYYSNSIVSAYKTTTRWILRAIFNTNFISKLRRLLPSKWADLGWYGNILLSKKAFMDMSSFSRKSGSARVSRFAGGTVILEKDEEESLFDEREPQRIERLFKLGWKSFVILDNRNKRMIFCSHLDRGLCSILPYSYIFSSLKSDKVYENIQALEKAVGGPFRRNRLKRLSQIYKDVDVVKTKHFKT